MDQRHWRKSTYSNQPDGECVEVGFGAGSIAIRDTKDRVGGQIEVAGRAWRAMLNQITR